MRRGRKRSCADYISNTRRFPSHISNQLTPSFFCRLVEEVVYWKSSFFSGYT